MSLDVLNLSLVLVAALAGGRLAVRLGYPSILGELMAGIILGPPLLGLLQPDDALAVIGKLGVVLLMLYIGLHLDPADLGKAAKPGALAAIGGFIVPAALGFGLMMLVDGDPLAAIFVAVAMGVTSLATKSRILVDLGILNTRIAHVLLAGALFSDVAALLIFAVVLGLAATGTVALGGIAMTTLQAAIFLVGAWIVGTRVVPYAGRKLTERKVDDSTVFFLVVLLGLGLAAAADAAGLHAILGAFIAGLFIRHGVLRPEQLAAVESKARGVSLGLLAPVFFVTAGFKVSFDVFTAEPWLLAAVIVVATVGKIFGTALFYIPTGFGFREGIAVGAGMNGRGAVEIIVAELALAAGLIDATIFSILVFMAIFTTATVPVFLTQSINWLRRRGELATDERTGVVVVGAGPLSRRLAQLLGDTSDVTLVDTNAAHCRAAARSGLEVVNGNALDFGTLEDAGASDAKMLIAATANAEVNLLAARIAGSRFGIPELYVALGGEASAGLTSLLDELGGELLFGRQEDMESWDADLEAGRLVDLDYSIGEPEDVAETATADAIDMGTVTLPLVIKTRDGVVPFTGQQDLAPTDTIIGLGRPQAHRHFEAERVESV